MYSKPGEYTGPAYQSMKVTGNKVTLTFTHTGSGLITKDNSGNIGGFEIAGADKQFHAANASIENNKIIFSPHTERDKILMQN